MTRIELLASLSNGSNTLCDIGCDHAYTLVMAIKKYGVLQGIASEVALGPLENAKKTIKENKLEAKIKTIISDGFDNISRNEFDTVIISGMGGALITDILRRGLTKIIGKKLILEANNESFKVRRFLLDNHFKIDYETDIIEKEKYYEIIVASSNEMHLDYYDIMYGPILRKNRSEYFLKYYQDKFDLLNSVILKIQDDTQKDLKKKQLAELKYILDGVNMNKYFIMSTENYYRTYFVSDKTLPTIIVSPGGGYKYTSPRESEPVVEAFNKLGYHVVVVNYRETNEDAYPLPGTYLASAIKDVSKDKRVGKLIGLGFSAGGHCILELLLHKDKYNFDVKIDYLMLGYPVITSDPKYSHKGSFENLLFDKVNDAKMLTYLSLENEVTKECAPELFLWGTYTDESVSVMNSLLLLEAYKRANVNAEYHMFPLGGHGLSVANSLSSEGNKEKESPYIARWVIMATEWLKLKLSK